MTVAGKPYVQQREGEYYVGGTRVTLFSLIAAWQTEGYTAEEAKLAFPALTLAQVYGAIAFYLERQPTLDAVFRDDAEVYLRRRAQSREDNADFYRALDERKASLLQQRLAQHTPPSAPDELDQAHK
jgi:uncharacterized protein (DUF433 family)